MLYFDSTRQSYQKLTLASNLHIDNFNFFFGWPVSVWTICIYVIMSKKTVFLIVLAVLYSFMESGAIYNEDLYENVKKLLQNFESYQIPLNNQAYFGDETNILPISKYLRSLLKVFIYYQDQVNILMISIKIFLPIKYLIYDLS